MIAKVASSVVEGLKTQPMALALIIMNLIFAGVIVYLLMHVSASLERRDAIISDLIRECRQQQK